MISKNILKLEINNKTKHLEKYLRSQWSWKTYFSIISLISVLTFIVIDLEKMLLSSRVAFEWKMTSNSSYYFAEYENSDSRRTYTLNRITLELRLQTVLKRYGKPDPRKGMGVSVNKYQCERTERI